MPRSPKADKADLPKATGVSDRPKDAAKANKRDGRATTVKVRSRDAASKQGEGDELTRGTDPDMAPDPRDEEN